MLSARKNFAFLVSTMFSLSLCGQSALAQTASSADKPAKDAVQTPKLIPLELFTTIDKYMPRGIFVTDDNRTFITLPRHDATVPYTLCELKNKQLKPYPSLEINQFTSSSNKDGLASVMSTRSDKGLLWVLDSGRVGRQKIALAAKLVAIDLATNTIKKSIPLNDEVVMENSLLKDFCIVDNIGKAGVAIIADSSPLGDNGFVIVDLENGKSFRRLHKSPSVSAEPEFVIFVDGEMVRFRESDTKKTDMLAGVSGLGLTADKKTLIYSPMASHSIYSVNVEKLCDQKVPDKEVVVTVKSLGSKIGASDSLIVDGKNNIYLTDLENNAIWLKSSEGEMTKIATDTRLSWPDRLCLTNDGYLYVTASQLHRSPWYHIGKDLRKHPFEIFRLKVPKG